MKKILCLLLVCLLLVGIGILPASADTNSLLRRVYTPETKLVVPPTVIQMVDSPDKLTALSTVEAPPQAAWFTLKTEGSDLTVAFKNGSTDLKCALAACKGTVIPVIETVNETQAKVLANFLANNWESDLIVASPDPAALTYLRRKKFEYMTLAYIAYGDDRATIARQAHSSNAMICVLPDADRATAEYFQKRFLTVTLRRVDDSADRNCVGAAVDCGANGVVVSDPAVAYDLYRSVTRTTVLRRPFVVGHRCYPDAAPENTVEGLRAAFEHGADAVECDIYLTQDGHVVINHNNTIDNCTTDPTATGLIEGYTRDQLKTFTLKPVGEYTNCRFAFLDEFFQELKKEPDKMLVVEIKSNQRDVIKKMRSLAIEYGVLDQIVAISFSTTQLTNTRAIIPEIGLSLLTSASGEAMSAAQTLIPNIAQFPDSASPDYNITGETIALLNHRGYSVNVWTVNDLSSLRTQTNKGALFLTTDSVHSGVDIQESLGELTCERILGFKPAAATVVTTKSDGTTTTTTKKPATSTTSGEQPAASASGTTAGTLTDSVTTALQAQSTTADDPYATTADAAETTSSTSSVASENIVTTTTATQAVNGGEDTDASSPLWWILLVVLAGAGVGIFLFLKHKKAA